MTSDLKNVVIVGVGLAAADLIHQLVSKLPSTHRVVAVSSSDFAFWAPAALRAAVVPGWEGAPIVELDRLLPKGSRHRLISNTTVVELHQNHVILSKDDGEFGNKLEFEYIILATGSKYAFPCRPKEGSITASDVINQFKHTQQEVADSKSILIVGAGPVGIEFAAEVASQHPGKKITLVSNGDKLLPDFRPAVGQGLESQLRKLGVEIVYDAKVDIDGLQTGKIEPKDFELGSSGSARADYVMIAIGNKPNTSLVSKFDPSSVNDSGLIKCKPTLQLESHDNMFAIGDVTDTNETKLYYNSTFHVPIIVANVVSLAGDQTSLKTYQPRGHSVIVVTCGPSGGMSQLPVLGLVVGSWVTALAKSKGLMVSKFRSAYNY
ncbi:hypothetical protein OIO90_001896 [Microbotryomycetes sp. JL221]|nr:hypothetical protein OIO90_001896 [Microbotryomycetes sp. JL221]